jgi:cupin fold WbuC family metalloprotein
MGVQTLQLLSPSIIDDTIRAARESPRRRMNHNFHGGPRDNPHRFLNVLLDGTYIRPHRHLNPPKPETFVLLEGHTTAVIFDDDGRVIERHVLGRGPLAPGAPEWCHAAGVAALGIDLASGVWHTICAISQVAVCFEVKPGPWDPASDKDFAPWAPPEGDPAAPAYLAGLLR